jgi:hypothetical protein
MESDAAVWPGVDTLIEFGHKSAGEDLGTLPTDPGIDPCLLCPCEIVGGNAGAQLLDTHHGAVDILDETRPVLFSRLIEGCRVSRTGHRCNEADTKDRHPEDGGQAADSSMSEDWALTIG